MFSGHYLIRIQVKFSTTTGFSFGDTRLTHSGTFLIRKAPKSSDTIGQTTKQAPHIGWE